MRSIKSECAPAYECESNHAQSTGAISETERQTIDKALRIIETNAITKGDYFADSTVAKDYFRIRLAGYKCEFFSIAFLDNRHRLIQCRETFRGTVDGSTIYPREVVRDSLIYNAAAVVFAHNHPSDNPEPSNADRQLTDRLITALSCIDVRVLDHIVVGSHDAVAFSERNWI